MNGRGRTIAAVVLGLFLASAAFADTLELKDGRVLQGRYLGGTQAVLRFEINGEVRTFNVTEAVAITFTGTSGKASAPAPAPSPALAPPPASVPAAPPSRSPDASAAPAPDAQPPVTSQDVVSPTGKPTALASQTPPPQDPAAQYGEITIPAGQSLLVRMIDGVDSSKNHVGDVFHASLETDLYRQQHARGARREPMSTDGWPKRKEAGHLSRKLRSSNSSSFASSLMAATIRWSAAITA